MDAHDELAERIALAADQIAVLARVAKQSGLNPESKRVLVAPLRTLVALLNRCISEEVTQEFIASTLARLDQAIPAILAAIVTEGSTN